MVNMKCGTNMNKNNRFGKPWLWCIIVLLFIVAFILGNALLDYNASHSFSGWLVRLLGMDMQTGEQNGDFVLRKIAHVAEYALLGFFTLTVRAFGKTKKPLNCIWFSLFFVLAVAVLDEFFQSFGGRNSTVSDVLLDFVGALMGIALAAFLEKLLRKKKNNAGGFEYDR